MSSTVRIACLRIPRFPIGAVWPENSGRESGRDSGRGDSGRASGNDAPHWDTLPLALTHPAHPDRLHLVTGQATSLGVLPGMSVTAARAVAAGLDVRPWDARAIGDACHCVTAALLRLSPQVTPGRPGTWWIGVHGLPSRRSLLPSLLAIGRAWHPGARAGVASSAVAAHAATWLTRSSHVVPPGEDRTFLARSPLALIPMGTELRDTLAALGLTLTGQLAALDPGDVEQRFGPPGLAAWRLAQGEDHRRPMLARPAPDDTVELELEVPTTTLEPVLFLVRAALGRLLDAVRGDAQAIARLEVELRTGNGGGTENRERRTEKGAMVRVAPARALARLEPLYEQCRAALEDLAVDAPITGIVVRVVERAPASGEQGDLLHTGWRDPAAADAAFVRLRAALGPGTVVRPAARDGFVPERRGEWGEGSGRGNSGRANSGRDSGRTNSGRVETTETRATFRLLQPAESIGTDGAAFTWRNRRWGIAASRDAERLSGDWWHARYARDYCTWESEGVLFLAYQDGDGWFLQGWWD